MGLVEKFKNWLSALVKPQLLKFTYLGLKFVKAFVFASLAFYTTAVATNGQAFSWSLVHDIILAGIAGALHALSHVTSPKARKGD